MQYTKSPQQGILKIIPISSCSLSLTPSIQPVTKSCQCYHQNIPPIALLFFIFTIVTGHHHLPINCKSLLTHLPGSLLPLSSSSSSEQSKRSFQNTNHFMQILQWLPITIRTKSQIPTILYKVPASFPTSCHTFRARYIGSCFSFLNWSKPLFGLKTSIMLITLPRMFFLPRLTG